jgi:hypothetical protein
MSGPYQVQEIEQRIQCHNQKSNVSIWQSTNEHLEEPINTTGTPATAAEHES